uniref:ATP-dependent Clp protease ATP-binding subunit ClpX n=1 Tax=Caenorhabditis tropicalis TaxID=1561998 RepID=A0A1I7UKZ3_9PELO
MIRIASTPYSQFIVPDVSKLLESILKLKGYRISVTSHTKLLYRGKSDRRVIHAKKISKKTDSLPFVIGEGFISGKTLIQNALTHQPPNGLTKIGRDGGRNEKMTILYPKEIVEHLNKYVIGQEEAKKCLAVAVYQHYRRVENNMRVTEQWMLSEAASAIKERKKLKKQNPDIEEEYLPEYIQRSQRQILKDLEKRQEILLEKSNMILLGASGTGKTFMTQKLAEVLDVPIVICDCTTLTQAGYVGDDVDTVIQKLLAEAAGDIEKCQRGIVFLDEFDKIYTSSDPLHTSGNRDVSGKGVQQALLKLVEGSLVKVRDPLAPNSKVTIDTTNILFISSGAFSNIEHIIARRLDKRSLGFSSSASPHECIDQHTTEKLRDSDEEVVSKARDEMIKQCDQGDLISFGMIPELVGRFPVTVPFHCLDKSHLISVLTEPKGSLVAQTKKFFENENVELRFSPEAIEKIAEMAVKRKTGARALKSIVEKAVMNAKYEVPGSDVKCVEINDENLKDHSFTVIENLNEIGKENK